MTTHPPQIDGEVVESEPLAPTEPTDVSMSTGRPAAEASAAVLQRAYRIYVFIPFLLLTVTLLGGIRLSSPNNGLIFLKPALVCLVFALLMMALFFRAGLIRIDGWFSESFTAIKNMANGAVLLTVFAASAQVFNSLLPEQGLPFWVVAFCFFWVLWNNLFADFDVRKLLRSLAALFGLAFVVKYLLLANMTAPESSGWLRAIWENPGKEAMTWLLDLPRHSPGSGYIQFFTVVLYGIALYMFPPETGGEVTVSVRS